MKILISCGFFLINACATSNFNFNSDSPSRVKNIQEWNFSILQSLAVKEQILKERLKKLKQSATQDFKMIGITEDLLQTTIKMRLDLIDHIRKN